ncbi:MAG: peptidoglycan DD-metalloendopeptidase family protein [Candidatus Tectimicrobiota bacterium]
MGRDTLTVIMLPSGAGRPRTVVLRRRWVRLAGLVGLGCLAVLIVGAFSYRTLRQQVVDLAYLQAETSSQRVELASMAEEVEGLRDRLQRLQKMDRKLRLLASLEPPQEGSTSLLGVGGPSPSASSAGEVFIADRQSTLIETMRRELAKLKTAASRQEASFHDLVSAFYDLKSHLAFTPSIWPVRGWVTSGFGPRLSPFTGKRVLHTGIDIATRTGALIVAPADGVVTGVATEFDYGKILTIDHGYGLTTRYGHGSKVLVQPGQRVRRGDPIARVGNTGRTTGPHLHYEVRLNGVPVNPKRYVVQDETL